MTTTILITALAVHLILMLAGTIVIVRGLATAALALHNLDNGKFGLIQGVLATMNEDLGTAIRRLPKTRAPRSRLGAVSPRPPLDTKPDGVAKS